MRATVTGADGFVGQWLIRHLIEEGHEITGLIRGEHPDLTTLDAARATLVDWRPFRLGDVDGARALLDQSRPDVVFHLAAQSSVPASIQNPVGTFEANVLGTAALLEACRTSRLDPTVLVVGSSDAYGPGAGSEPLRENAPLRPRNPYAASKAAAEYVALQYAQAGWARVVVTRSFNHTGPGQTTNFAVASFAKQIADIKRKRKEPPLRTGSLVPRRDLSDVRDVVHAYAMLGVHGHAGRVYNICSGNAPSMGEIVERLLRIAGVQAEVTQDPALVRAVETPVLLGDPTLIQTDVGWRPAIALEQTLSDLLDYFMHDPA
ncbi:MAG: hypothetical protein DLM53_10660 [Candidatus Eremiobacter antarcticus]|nr:GDP-mannose 4,6-dehydratase [Candidatus Eremiobacteraeota bacterium]PZR60811.1 MAG: hypothetical protein DLM53_10660 [Candidatus Eremiobacter sp. RRmetagenome_bin22]